MKITRNDDGTFTAECEPGDVRYDALTHRALVIFPATPEFGRSAGFGPPDQFVSTSFPSKVVLEAHPSMLSPDQRKSLCEAVGAALLKAIAEAPQSALRM